MCWSWVSKKQKVGLKIKFPTMFGWWWKRIPRTLFSRLIVSILGLLRKMKFSQVNRGGSSKFNKIGRICCASIMRRSVIETLIPLRRSMIFSTVTSLTLNQMLGKKPSGVLGKWVDIFLDIDSTGCNWPSEEHWPIKFNESNIMCES